MSTPGDTLRRWRDRLLGDPGFHRFAAAFAPTRPVARRRAQALFDLCAGFVYAQTLSACVRLDLFAILADGPAPLDVISRRLGLRPERARILLRAAAALDLAERRSGGRWGLGPLGAALRGAPGVVEMVRHHDMLYADLQDPVALLRQDDADRRLARFWGYSGGDRAGALTGEEVAPYSALMSASLAMVAEDTLAAFPLADRKRLLDVGGGEGAFLIAAGRAAPRLELALFDLPPVAARAARRLAETGLAERAATYGGDFLRDPLPKGADVISLIRIAHDHDDDALLGLLRAAREALPEGGMLLISEPMAGAPRPNRAGDAYFGMYLLAMGAGRPRTPDELETMLRSAGFSSVQRRRTRRPMLTSVLVAVV